jgi:hypothetical protein
LCRLTLRFLFGLCCVCCVVAVLAFVLVTTRELECSIHVLFHSLRTHSVISIATLKTRYHQHSSPPLTAIFLVDIKGGPNHLGNNCDAPIVTLEDFSDIHVQPKYFYFGHISKYVPPGSVRVESHTVGECSKPYALSQMRLNKILNEKI